MALVGSNIAVGEQTVCNRTIAQWHWQRALFEQHNTVAQQCNVLRQYTARCGSGAQEGEAPGHCAFAQQWAKPGKQRSGDIFVPGGTSRAARASEALSECTLARVTTSAERRACSVAQSGAERASSLGPPNSRSSTVITRYRPSAPACRNGVLRVLRAYRGTQSSRVLRVLIVHHTASPQPHRPAGTRAERMLAMPKPRKTTNCELLSCSAAVLHACETKHGLALLSERDNVCGQAVWTSTLSRFCV
jgi:hypothetical protein